VVDPFHYTDLTLQEQDTGKRVRAVRRMGVAC
jgi:hypothetical protein